MNTSAQVDRAAQVRTLLSQDSGAAGFGIQLLEIDEDGLTLSMTVRDDMLNPGGTCHGGALFLLGDTAVGQAASAQSKPVITTSATITYLAAARAGDVLHARAYLKHSGGKSGVVDAEISTDSGTMVALVRGHVLRPAG